MARSQRGVISKKRKLRRLQVSVAGGWYVALTIAMGVVALVSGNNVLYLIESLLLSGLIFSGILSERTISALHIEVQRRPAEARRPLRDQLILRNQRAYPVFCIEISEWVNGRQLPLAFVPRIGPNETLTVASQQKLERRGEHCWDGFAISTRYPFGFARKTKLVWRPGRRIVWPESMRDGKGRLAGSGGDPRRIGSAEIQDGEVRAYTLEDDMRLIVWTLSARGGSPMVRVSRAPDQQPEVQLDLRSEPGPAFENAVSRAAGEIQGSPGDGDSSLTLIEWEGRRRVRGRSRALNSLALAEPLGSKRNSKNRRPAA